MATGSIDAIFQELEKKVGVLEAKKSALMQENQTLDAQLRNLSSEKNRVSGLVREEEAKLASYGEKRVEIERESLSRIAAEQMKLDDRDTQCLAREEAVLAKEKEVQEREGFCTRKEMSFAETELRLQQRSADLDSKDKDLTMQKEELTRRMQEVNAKDTAMVDRENNADRKEKENTEKETLLNERQADQQKIAEELQTDKNSLASRMREAEQKEDKAKLAQDRMQRVYNNAYDVLQKISQVSDDPEASAKIANEYLASVKDAA